MITLFLRSFSIVGLLLAGLYSAASAQVEGEDETSVNQAFAAIMDAMPRDGDLIMVPWASGLGTLGDVEKAFIDAPDVPGGKALRVTAEKSRNNWDSQINTPIGPAVAEGDLLVMVFYARVEEGSGELPYNSISRNAPPYNALIQDSVTVGNEWDIYVVQGKADKDYGQNSLGVSMHLANADHTIDFGPVFVLNLGQ